MTESSFLSVLNILNPEGQIQAIDSGNITQ